MRKRVVVGISAASLGVGVALAMTLGGAAEAIPVPAQNCRFDVLSNTAVNGWQPVTGSTVTVNNGASPRRAVVNFNADAGVDTLAEIRVGYRVDAGGIQTPGAQNFANHTEYWQTRHSMVVMSMPAGWHSVQAYWRISGAAGKNGVINSRCLTIESLTS